MAPMSETLAPSVTSRDPKGLKLVSIVTAAYDKAWLTEEEAQRVNEAGGLADLIGKFISDNRSANQFASEEVASTYGYLSGYTKPVAVTDQVDILRGYWPRLNPDSVLQYYREVYPSFELPGWVEGPIVAIRTGFFSDNYGEELEEVLKALKKARDGELYNCREGQLGAEYLRQSERTQAKLRVLTERQWGSDLLILPAQLGIRHRGRSVRRARETMSASEFGLGSAITGTAILTNPIRLTQYDDLWIDCAGDEYSPDADGVFGGAPFVSFDDDEVKFGADEVEYCDDGYGSASGFLPQ